MFLPIILYRAARRREKLREQVKASGLARAVRTDQRVNRAAFDLEIYVADSNEAREFFCKIFRLENVFATHTTPIHPALIYVPPMRGSSRIFCVSPADRAPEP